MKTTIQPIHFDTGTLIKTYCDKKRIYKAALARKTGINYQSLLLSMKVKTIDVNKLITISHGLGHNFLLDIAAQLPSTYTTDAVQDTSAAEEIAALKEKIKLLEANQEVLLKALGK